MEGGTDADDAEVVRTGDCCSRGSLMHANAGRMVGVVEMVLARVEPAVVMTRTMQTTAATCVR